MPTVSCLLPLHTIVVLVNPILLINWKLSFFLRFLCGPVFSALFASLFASFRSRAALQLEILALRHQLGVLQRSVKRPKLTAADRFLWAWLCRVWNDWRSGTFIVNPATVIGWHRKGFRLFWTWRIRRGKPGRPAVPKDVRDLIRTMSRENPLWGAPRIHGELLKPGISIGESRMNDSRGLRLTLPSSNRRCRFPTSGSPEDSRLRLAHGPIRTGAAHE
jgi:hypothetical protein